MSSYRGLWVRRDITVFIEKFGTSQECKEYMEKLESVCPMLKFRNSAATRYRSGHELCLGWNREPLWQYSWGGYDSYVGSKVWGHQEFLDHVGYNNG
jgi:hypothetical protein